VRTAGLIPVDPAGHPLLAEFLIIVALTAIGLSANLRRWLPAARAPADPAGLQGVWVAVHHRRTVSSLLVQLVIGQL
jgi:hypothetical protein